MATKTNAVRLADGDAINNADYAPHGSYLKGLANPLIWLAEESIGSLNKVAGKWFTVVQ